jgi:predicted ATP-binding protein involved in virulence
MSKSVPVGLKRLELENFRGFENLALDFEDDLTVLVGANGAGKTTVLDAIVCTLTGEKQPTDARAGTTHSTVRLTIAAGGGTHDIELRFSLRADGERMSGSPKLRGSGLRIFVYRVARQVRDRTFDAVEGKIWTQSRTLDDWQNASVSFEDFFHWFKYMEDLENEQLRYEEGGQNPQLAAVRRAIRTLLPEFEAIRVRRRMAPMALHPVLMLRKKGGVDLPFNALSEGERTTIAMVGDIARRLVLCGEHEDPLQTSATVLIDEIEQHAHPGWQRQILRRFRQAFPNVQLITTTHSPVIVSEVEPRQLRVLKDFALVPSEHGTGRDANAVLEDVFEVSPRTEEVQVRLNTLAAAIDGDEFEKADRLLAELDVLVPGGADPDIVYYRNLLALMRAS